MAEFTQLMQKTLLFKKMQFFKNPKVFSAILATISALSLTTMLSFAKALQPNLPTTLVISIKSFFGLMFFIPILIYNREDIVRSNNIYLHTLRIILAISSMFCTYYAYRTLPVAFATSIGMSGPLFTTILSWVLLKENINPIKWCVIIFGYIGVLIIIRPTTFFLDLGTANAVLANVLSACIVIIIKIVSRRDSTITIMFYHNIGITLLAVFLFNINDWSVLSPKDLIFLLFMGLLSIITQFCSATALKYSSPSFIVPFEYIRMIFAILIGFIFFCEIPDIYTLFGSVIISVSIYMLVFIDTKEKLTK